jgi:hypothetical protein
MSLVQKDGEAGEAHSLGPRACSLRSPEGFRCPSNSRASDSDLNDATARVGKKPSPGPPSVYCLFVIGGALAYPCVQRTSSQPTNAPPSAAWLQIIRPSAVRT